MSMEVCDEPVMSSEVDPEPTDMLVNEVTRRLFLKLECQSVMVAGIVHRDSAMDNTIGMRRQRMREKSPGYRRILLMPSMEASATRAMPVCSER